MNQRKEQRTQRKAVDAVLFSLFSFLCCKTMAAFEYQALDILGHAVKGVIEGDAERQVRAALREKGLTPLQVEVIDQRAETRQGVWHFSFRRGIPGSELALLTRQFATLIHAGLTI